MRIIRAFLVGSTFIALTLLGVSVNAPVSDAATLLGGVQLTPWCKTQATENKDLAYAEAGTNAYNWKCWYASGSIWIGYKWWSGSVNVNGACKLQYKKSNAYGKALDPKNPYSWRCYR